MTRARVRTRSLTMEARVAALEASNSKTQLMLEAIQRLLEAKFVSIDKRFDSIDSHREGSVQPFPPPFDDDDGDGFRLQGEKEKGFLVHRESILLPNSDKDIHHKSFDRKSEKISPLLVSVSAFMPSEITTHRDVVHNQVDSQWDTSVVIDVGFDGFQPTVQSTSLIPESPSTQGFPAYLSSFSIGSVQQIFGFFSLKNLDPEAWKQLGFGVHTSGRSPHALHLFTEMPHSCWVCQGGNANLDFDLGYYMGIQDKGGGAFLTSCFIGVSTMKLRHTLYLLCLVSIQEASALCLQVPAKLAALRCGLCFQCDACFVDRHTCAKKQFLLLAMEGDDYGSEGVIFELQHIEVIEDATWEDYNDLKVRFPNFIAQVEAAFNFR